MDKAKAIKAELIRRELASRDKDLNVSSQSNKTIEQPAYSGTERSMGQMMASGPSNLGVGVGEFLGFYGREVPSAAIRSGLRGQGYFQGAMNPSESQTFSQEWGKGEDIGIAGVVGAPKTTVGMAADFATNPADILTTLITARPVLKAGTDILNKIKGVKFGSIPRQLGPAKPTSDNIESTIKVLQNNMKDVDSMLKSGIREVDASVSLKNSAVKNASQIEKANAAEDALKLELSNKAQVEKLAQAKSRVADAQAQKIQNKISWKANKSLNEKFGAEYKTLTKGKRINVDDAVADLESALKERGILGDGGKVLREAVDAEVDVVNLYNKLKARTPNDVIRLDVDSIPLEEWDKGLQDILARGKQYRAGQNILTDVRYATSGRLKETRALRSRFASDFKARNGVNKHYRAFASGGDTEVNASRLNILNDQKNFNYGNVKREMEFLKKYAGEDPSQPVVKIGGMIDDLKRQVETTKAQNSLRSFALDKDVSSKQAMNLVEAEEVKANLAKAAAGKKAKLEAMAYEQARNLERVRKAEKATETKKNIAKTVAWTTGGLFAGNKAVGAIRKFID